MNLPESEIIEKAKRGDTTAFRKLVEGYQGFAYTLAYRMLHHHDEVQDIVQDAFIKCWKALPRFDGRIKFSTWLYKIVMNLCLDVIKSARYRHSKMASDVSVDFNLCDAKTSDDALHQQEFIDSVLKMAEQLTPKQRAVFILRDLEDVDMAEIGVILSISSGTVKSNLYYARKKMNELLKGFYQHNPLHEL